MVMVIAVPLDGKERDDHARSSAGTVLRTKLDMHN